MKKLIIVAVLVIVLCSAVLAYLYIFKKPATTDNQPVQVTQIKPLPKPEVPVGETISLNTPNGPIAVKNFYKYAQKIIEASVILKDTPNYAILYFSNTNEFLINIYAYNATDANSYRSLAEKDLITLLDSNQADLCKPTVNVKVPQSYSEDLSSIDYGLSFCPNGVPLTDSNNIR